MLHLEGISCIRFWAGSSTGLADEVRSAPVTGSRGSVRLHVGDFRQATSGLPPFTSEAAVRLYKRSGSRIGCVASMARRTHPKPLNNLPRQKATLRLHQCHAMRYVNNPVPCIDEPLPGYSFGRIRPCQQDCTKRRWGLLMIGYDCRALASHNSSRLRKTLGPPV